MLENLEKVQGATQSYIDMFGKAMQGLPGANQDAIANFKTYLERQVAANRDFGEKLVRAKDFQEAFRIQVEHFQSQLKVVAEDASNFGSQRRPRKSAQDDKWNFCLTTAIIAVNRRSHEQTTPPEPLTGLQGEGGSGRHQGRPYYRPTGGAFRRPSQPDHDMEIAA